MKLSISMITYNHERFIVKALDSILMQRVDFDYEIVVGEDCSTDATREILLDYQKKFPDKIRLLLPEKNLGMMVNFCATLQACRGEYIALLEGDDYWTSPDKLQKQVDFLESNPECSGCFHNVFVVNDGFPAKNKLFHEHKLRKHFFQLRDIIVSHFIPTCSTVFRSKCLDSFPDWFVEMPMGDWPLHILNAQHGPYAYIDEVMAVYRIHGEGVWSSRSRLALIDSTITACSCIRNYLEGRYAREIGKFTRDFEIEASKILTKEQKHANAAFRLLNAFRVSPSSFFRILKCSISLLSDWLKHTCFSKKLC